MIDPATSINVEMRARLSQGTSAPAIYQMVAGALAARQVTAELLVDVGCGTGNLWHHVRDRFRDYLGLDAVRYEGFPADGEFMPVDLDVPALAVPDRTADVVAAVETIEHLENPRAFLRELVRLTKPGGWVVVTTPNQLSILSKLTLLLKNQFNAFQEGSYPAHLTALLEVDLRRMARECGLEEVEVRHSCQGRVAVTARTYPRFLSRLFPRAFSDNVLLIGRKPRD
jgi:2-polyprenyl-3-methyl-5-hydroxy-6-metoxy-1,4-benzoquinol methylase